MAVVEAVGAVAVGVAIAKGPRGMCRQRGKAIVESGRWRHRQMRGGTELVAGRSFRCSLFAIRVVERGVDEETVEREKWRRGVRAMKKERERQEARENESLC